MKVNFEVIHNERGWVVIRINGDYKQHAHLKSKHGVDILLDCIRKNKLPHSQYLQVSCQRLLNIRICFFLFAGYRCLKTVERKNMKECKQFCTFETR